MQALEELPEKAKDLILPYVHLRPWVGSHTLDKALGRIEKAYSKRPLVLDLAAPEPGEDGKERPVFSELKKLRNPNGGYANWCEFLEENKQFIPALQVRNPQKISEQAMRLKKLKRGVAVHIAPQMLGAISGFIDLIKPGAENGDEFCFVVDFGRQGENFLLSQLKTVAIVNALKGAFPGAYIAISASSFPEGFSDIEDQDIFERQHFDGVVAQLKHTGDVIYSDRGSARAEKQMGGGGTPAPRIDYAGATRWNFFRSVPVEKKARPAAYVAQAKKAIAHPCWDKKLQVWGHQMIEKTASNSPNCITSPKLSTAARINIHLHRQLYYGDAAGLYDTDEEWSDD